MNRFPIQAVIVVVVVAILTYLMDYLGFRSGLNALWMFGFPIAVAIIANKDAASRCLAGLILPVVSLIATMAIAAAFGLGT